MATENYRVHKKIFFLEVVRKKFLKLRFPPGTKKQILFILGFYMFVSKGHKI